MVVRVARLVASSCVCRDIRTAVIEKRLAPSLSQPHQGGGTGRHPRSQYALGPVGEETKGRHRAETILENLPDTSSRLAERCLHIFAWKMSAPVVNVTNIAVLNNPANFTDEFQFEITFEC